MRDRDWKPSTLSDNRSVVNAHLLPAFRGRRIEKITPDAIERADVPTTVKYMHHRSRAGDARLLSPRSRPKKARKASRKPKSATA